MIYAAQPEVCGACALKGRSTARSRRFVTRHLHEAALRGLSGAQTEMSLAVMAYNIKRMFNILGGLQLKARFSIV